jgi:mRNA-degrading endonuclease RelE of RelBE toxin-antitoxin system
LTQFAKAQFVSLRAYERALLRDQMQIKLGNEDAVVETRNRFRLQRESGGGEYELRVQHLRVFYRVEEERNAVIVIMIGRKEGNKLIVGDEEVPL